jgi:hypothetical protein
MHATNPINFITGHSNSDGTPYAVKEVFMVYSNDSLSKIMHGKCTVGKTSHFRFEIAM